MAVKPGDTKSAAGFGQAGTKKRHDQLLAVPVNKWVYWNFASFSFLMYALTGPLR